MTPSPEFHSCDFDTDYNSDSDSAAIENQPYKIFVLLVVEETPFEGLPNPGLRKYDEPSKGNQKQKNEASQTTTPPNGGLGRYRPESNQIPTDSAKGEVKICLEENNVNKWRAAATPMTSPCGIEAQSENNNDSLSITEQKHKRELVSLKESSSTEDQMISSSGPSVRNTIPFFPVEQFAKTPF